MGDELAEVLAEADAALEARARREAELALETPPPKLEPLPDREPRDLLPTSEPWLTAGELWRFTALAVPAGAVCHNLWRRFDATTCGPAAERFYELTGQPPAVYGTHHPARIAYGRWLGWWHDADGFHVDAVAMVPAYVGDCVSIGHMARLVGLDGVESESIAELSLLGALDGALEGATVESVTRFDGTMGDVVWRGQIKALPADGYGMSGRASASPG